MDKYHFKSGILCSTLFLKEKKRKTKQNVAKQKIPLQNPRNAIASQAVHKNTLRLSNYFFTPFASYNCFTSHTHLAQRFMDVEFSHFHSFVSPFLFLFFFRHMFLQQSCLFNCLMDFRRLLIFGQVLKTQFRDK